MPFKLYDRLHPQDRYKIYSADFIPASNEPSGHACMHIWRLPRGLWLRENIGMTGGYGNEDSGYDR